MLKSLKLTKSVAVTLMIVASLALGSFTSFMMGPGLNQAAPMGLYLNNNLPSTTSGTPPQFLSQTGAFADLGDLTPTAGVIPYDMIQPFWSDGADKFRWMAIPNNGSHNTAAERITFSADGNWIFPIGAVLIKHFELGGQRLETRFEVRSSSGEYYYLSYKWNSTGTDAQLLTTGLDETIIVNGQAQVWHYPSITECLDCHKASVDNVLGPKTRQLNSDIYYPETGLLANQLVTLSHIGIIDENITDNNVNNYGALAAQDDQDYSLEYRARSYLDVNCSYCHQPATGMRGNFDARITTPLEQQNLIDGGVFVDLGITDPRVITPQNTAKSIVHKRMNSVQSGVSMPPLGKNKIDTEGVALIADWINNLEEIDNSVQAVIDASIVQGPAPLSVNFNASGSVGNNLTYSWDFGDGNTAVGRTASHVYQVDGTYAVNLTVTDGTATDLQDLFIKVTPSYTTEISFADRTAQLTGANYSGVSMAVVDMNGDGKDDIVRYNQARDLNVQYQNNTNQNFSADNIGLVSNELQWSNAIADVDKNGFNDILTAGYYDNIKLIKNTGTGYGFTILQNSNIFIQGSNFADINNDGWVDIFACHDDDDSREYLNDGSGSFNYAPNAMDTRTNPASDNSGNYASIWTDYDNDGDLDLYISKCRGGVQSFSDPRRLNMLFQNDGNNNYTEVAASANLKIGSQTWLTDFADIDNDGDMDCIVINHQSESFLMLNNGSGVFTDITQGAGLMPYLDGKEYMLQGFFRDFDNDGYVDLIVSGEEHYLFHNDGDNTFTVADNPFTSDFIASMAIGDLNHDGFLDVYGGYNRLYNTPTNKQDRLFMNNGNPENHFIAIQLEGTVSNINGIGARIEIYGGWGQQIREVRSGEGYGVHNTFTQHFGLGARTAISKVVVKWPSGIEQEILNPAADQFLTIRESDNSCLTYGQPCNDFDNCTTNDLYDANCNCVGTFQDSDGDGICDSEDSTNGNCVVGQACNDNDACTINDVYNTNCDCAGTFQDSDGDGICDVEDNSNGACQLGAACNDNDPCTIYDVYDANCNCSGQVQDSDNDGVCDAYDSCNGHNDNQDSDNDGIPDGCDDCNNYLVGTACDDGEACTIGETYDQNCDCGGGAVLADVDGDGFCTMEDPDDNDPCTPFAGPECITTNQNCTVWSEVGFENGDMGIWIDGGADARLLNSAGYARTGSSSFYVQSNNGVSSSFYSSALDLSAAESVILTYYHLGYALEPNDRYVVEYSTSGSSYNAVMTLSSGTEISNSAYSQQIINIPGPFTSSTSFRFRAISNDAVDYFFFDDIQLEVCQDGSSPTCTIGQACNDNDDCTTNDVYDANCNCSGTFQDSDSDGICDANDNTNGNCAIGQVCNDNDPCTINDVFNSNCNCSGQFQDSDNDGVCDAYDVCNGYNDNMDTDGDGIPDGCDNCNGSLVGTACNDGINCTSGETYDINCNCTGGLQSPDNDNDGFCATEDPNDNDPCVPVAGPACGGSTIDCSTLNETGFEGLDRGLWLDGGANARSLLNASFAHTGSYSFYVQDGNGVSSSLFTSPLDLSEVESVTLSYYHLGYSLENQDSYVVEYALLDDAYSVVKVITAGIEISNGGYVAQQISISGPFTTSTKFRIRSIADQANDYFFFDDMKIEVCRPSDIGLDCIVGSPCDDNDDCTINDVYDVNCICKGSFQDSNNNGICDADESNPPVGSEDCTTISEAGFESNMGAWIDGGSDVLRYMSAETAGSGSYSIRLRDNSGRGSAIDMNNVSIPQRGATYLDFSYLAESMEPGEDFMLEIGEGGVFSTVHQWISGRDFQNDVRGYIRIDLNQLTTASVVSLRLRCDASSNYDRVYLDDIKLEYCNNESGGCVQGQACQDGDVCTQGDYYDADCNCVAGNIIDADGDGYCAAEDQNDNDPCIPDASACTTTGGGPCSDYDFTDFESGLGIWLDGGSDAVLNTYSQSASGTRSVRLRDDSGLASSIYTVPMNLAAEELLEVRFTFMPFSMEAGEEVLLEISGNGGSSFAKVNSWASATDFQNNVRQDVYEVIPASLLTSNTVLRIRCDASSNYDIIYVDDIKLEVCQASGLIEENTESEAKVDFDFIYASQVNSEVLHYKIFPNPTNHTLILDTNDPSAKADIMDSNGHRLLEFKVNEINDLSELSSGVYFVVVKTATDSKILKFIKI